jgi:hypothetical protein
VHTYIYIYCTVPAAVGETKNEKRNEQIYPIGRIGLLYSYVLFLLATVPTYLSRFQLPARAPPSHMPSE